LGIQNGDGYGNTCANHEVEHEPYCYVNKNACTEEGIEWFESSSTVIDTTSIGYSFDICTRNQNNKFYFLNIFKTLHLGHSTVLELVLTIFNIKNSICKNI
jgi:hypothetical protein